MHTNDHEKAKEILETVSRECGVSVETIETTYTSVFIAKQVTIMMMKRWTNLKDKDIYKRVGYTSVSAVSKAKKKMITVLSVDREARELIKRIEDKINPENNDTGADK